MIARIGEGETRPEHADAHLEILKWTGVLDDAAPEGNRSVFVLARVSREKAEFLLLALWDDWDSIGAFAGEPVDPARYYSEDDA